VEITHQIGGDQVTDVFRNFETFVFADGEKASSDLIAAGLPEDSIDGDDTLVGNPTAKAEVLDAGPGADTVIIEAGNTGKIHDLSWRVDLGNDTDPDKIVFAHNRVSETNAAVGPGHNTVAEVDNFDTSADRIAVLIDGVCATEGAFQTITASATQVSSGVKVVKLVDPAWTVDLGDDGHNGSVEKKILEATSGDLEIGHYTFVLYSSDGDTADAGIYSVHVTDSNMTSTADFVVEHIMTLKG